jgi:putative heme-binding domain-containing protein
VRQALTDVDESVRQAALHSISLHRDHDAVPALLALLKASSLHNRRAAAEALGRIGDRSAVSGLLEALGQPADRVLQHSLTYALIEIADRAGTAVGLTSKSRLTRRAALIALDQMDGGGLRPETVAPELASADPAMKETASWIVGRHPQWGGALAGFLRDRLAAKDLTPAERQELAGQLARFARTTAVQELLAGRLRNSAAPREVRRTVLRAMAQSALKQAPDAWVAGLTGILTGGDAELLTDAVATARALRVPKQHAEKLGAALLAIGTNPKTPEGTRLAALAAIPGGLTRVEPPLFDFLRARLAPDDPASQRALAADVLSHARLTPAQLGTLAGALKEVGPMEVDRLLDAFPQSPSEEVGLRLVAVLKEPQVRSGLRKDSLKPRLAKFGPRVQRQAEELYALLDADAGKQRARLEQLLASLKPGDVRRGQAVFNGPKAACSTCHAIGYLGGQVGPDLTHIAKVRTERDLLESIVFPSVSFVRSYEPVVVNTKSGKAYNGLLRKDAPDEIVLVTGADQQVRIAREDIEDMQPSKVSVMPTGLDQQLTPQDLADLVAFLRACK